MFVGTANLLRVDYNSMEGDGSRHINMIARQALKPNQGQLTSTPNRIEGTLASFEIQGEGMVVRKGVEDEGGVFSLMSSEERKDITEAAHRVSEV